MATGPPSFYVGLDPPAGGTWRRPDAWIRPLGTWPPSTHPPAAGVCCLPATVGLHPQRRPMVCGPEFFSPAEPGKPEPVIEVYDPHMLDGHLPADVPAYWDPQDGSPKVPIGTAHASYEAPSGDWRGGVTTRIKLEGPGGEKLLASPGMSFRIVITNDGAGG